MIQLLSMDERRALTSRLEATVDSAPQPQR
jgi:hypothetical protein